jgi:hypothetical protein
MKEKDPARAARKRCCADQSSLTERNLMEARACRSPL